VVRYSVGDTLDAWSLTAMGYDGSWQATRAPQRAIDAGAISRFEGIDDTQPDRGRQCSFVEHPSPQRSDRHAVVAPERAGARRIQPAQRHGE
jgi:hypothetical protein